MQYARRIGVRIRKRLQERDGVGKPARLAQRLGGLQELSDVDR
jgi:hypothetical protein